MSIIFLNLTTSWVVIFRCWLFIILAHRCFKNLATCRNHVAATSGNLLFLYFANDKHQQVSVPPSVFDEQLFSTPSADQAHKLAQPQQLAFEPFPKKRTSNADHVKNSERTSVHFPLSSLSLSITARHSVFKQNNNTTRLQLRTAHGADHVVVQP